MQHFHRLVCCFCLCGTSCVTLSCSARPEPQPSPRDEPAEIRVNDLPANAQESFKKLLGEAIVRSIPDKVKSEYDSFYRKLDDPIERSLVDNYDLLIDIPHDEDTLYSIYLVKPDKQTKLVRFFELMDGQVRVAMRYTCVKAEVAGPIAFLSVVRVVKGEQVMTEKVALYHPKTGWKPGPTADDKSGGERRKDK
jgi:hypothetical protein